MKPYLALFRAGPSSLHPAAVERLDTQNFDYALSYFGNDDPPADGAIFVHRQTGAKWPGLEQTLHVHWATISQYRYVWLPDDDLLCVADDVSRMFAICDDLQLELAQPALTHESYYTHLITMQHKNFQLRFTNFVEIMAPVLSIEMLARVMPTLDRNISGFGLDGLWPRLSQLGKVAIIDDTPVTHTRPIGGPNYQFSADAGLAPAHEDWLTAARHFIETPSDYHINLAGLLQNGDPICLGSAREEINAMLQQLIDSTRGVHMSALYMTRYLSNHLHYYMGGTTGEVRYPRALLRIVLNQVLKPLGIRFPLPPEPKEAAAVAAPTPVPTPTPAPASAATLAEAVAKAAMRGNVAVATPT